MSWKSFPSWTPTPLRRHVVLLVEWLRLANVLKRWRAEWTPLSISLAAAGVILAGATVMMLSTRLIAAVNLLAEYQMLTAVVAAVFAASTVARRRRGVHELHLQSWLMAAPIPQASVRISHTIRTLWPILALFFGAVSLTILVDLRAATAIACGLAFGTAFGWRAGIDRFGDRTPASHYVGSKSRGARNGRSESSVAQDVRSSVMECGNVHSKRTGAQALSAWPISQVRAWSRPENSRYVLVIALFAVQGGSSAAVGLSVVALYFIGSYLAALLSASMSVAKSASEWLRSTPLTLSEFVWLLSRRALIHQILGTTLAATCVMLLGAPLMLTLQLVALWLGVVISVSGCALVDCYRGRSPIVKMAMCVVAWTAVLAMLQLRSAERT